MATSPNRVEKLLEIGRRSTLAKAVVCTTCMTLIMVAVVARVGKAASPTASPDQRHARMHQRNRFFDPAAAAAAVVAATPSPGAPVTSFPIVDQVVSLKEVPVAEPMAVVWDPATLGPIPGPDRDLLFQPLAAEIVKDQTALIALGKALFWDMQVGSDGVQACATCHFNAGADIRTTNQVNSGQASEDFHHPLGGDSLYGNSTVPFTANDPLTPNPPGPADPPKVGTCTGFDPLSPLPCNVPGHPNFAPNSTVSGGDFPLNDWAHPTQLVPRGPSVTFQEEFADVTQDTNDVVSSQGIRLTQFTSVVPGSAADNGSALADIANTVTPGVPNLSGVQRRTEPRNAPTMINAIFNYDNLWDGKASFIFNGWDAFGFRNRTSTLRENVNGTLTSVFIRITNSSLASVAAAVPTSNITMSYQGRSMPDVGVKMLSLRPLGKQHVHRQDSVLGRMAREENTGLKFSTYADMIKAAFQDQWWNSTTPVAFNKNSYTQMQFNFSLFFGLAVQAYEATLISDDTPFDRFEGAFNPVRLSDGSPCPATGCAPIAPDPNALTQRQLVGLTLFMDDAANIGTHCADCHVPPITTGHTILDYQPDAQGVPSLAQGEAIEFMIMGDDQAEANYDHGMYNIGVRRTTDDKGRKATGGSPNPLTGSMVGILSISRTANVVTVNTAASMTLAAAQFVTISGVADKTFNGTFTITAVASPTQFKYTQTAADASSSGGNAIGPNATFPFSLVELTALRDSTACDAVAAANNFHHIGCLPLDVARFVPNVPILPRRVTHGAFKAPNLRNIKFTGPYFHVGDSATLRQVVEFYTRGGNFPNTNLHDKTVDVDGIPPFMNPDTDPTAEESIRSLVDFLAEGLKDPRVAFERAPFDHPELIVPNGSPANNPSGDVFMTIAAVGRHGREKELPTFLNLDPQQSDTSVAARGNGEGNAGNAAAAVSAASTGGYPGSASAGGAANTQASSNGAAINGAPTRGKDWNGNVPAGFAEAGYIQAATLDSAAANSGGTLTMNGTKMIVPANSIIQMPANTLSWAQLFQQLVSSPVYDSAVPTQVNLTIPAGTTGMALLDNPTRTLGVSPYVPFNAIVIGNIDVRNSTGNGVGAYIVGLILPIGQDLGNSGQGVITYIDYAKGRFEVGGTLNVPNTGTVVEINDPTGRYGYAHSPDPRWSVDPDNPTIASSNGYPMGIPKGAPTGDPDRPATNRPLNPPIGAAGHDPFLQAGTPLEVFAMPPSSKASSTTPDPWKQAPLMVGDYVIYSGILCKNDPAAAISLITPWARQTYISANTVSATQLIILTAPGDAGTVGPAYVHLERGVVGTDGSDVVVPANPSLGIVGGTIPAIDVKNNIVIVGFVTDPSQLVDIFAADIDPVTGVETDRLLGTTLPDPGLPGPPGTPPRGPVGRFRFDVLRGSFQPTTRVYVAQSRHGTVSLLPQVGNIHPANGLLAGQYHAPMFTFVYLETVPGFPIIPNNFNSQPFLVQGEGGNLAPAGLNPFPPSIP